MEDVAISLLLLAIASFVAAAYGARVRFQGALHYARVESAGASPLLGRRPMEMVYFGIAPMGAALVRWGVSANTVTAFSLVFGVAAGVALAFGHYGVAAGLTALSAVADALDGFVAREAGTASDAGETFDAAVDRYVEFFFFGGLLFLHRASAAWVLLVLLALGGSFMVSYSTAKAEALHVDAPRGAMRRTERAAYLTFGALLTPLTAPFLPPVFAEAPIALAVAVVAVAANISAVHRFVRIADLVAVRAAGERAVAPNRPSRVDGKREAVNAETGRATT